MTYHHLSVLVHRQAEKYGDKVALKYRDYETAQWIPISWNQFSGLYDKQLMLSWRWEWKNKRISVYFTE